MKFQHVIGSLETTQPQAVTLGTRRSIYDAATEFGLYTLLNHDKWEDGVITIDNLSTYTEAKALPSSSSVDFIANLEKMLSKPGVKELELDGGMILTNTDEGLVQIFKIAVTKGEVSYQHAALGWGESVTTKD